MTRARKNGDGVEKFGHISRAFVGRVEPGRWDAHMAGEGDLFCHHFPSWREAMDYALGADE